MRGPTRAALGRLVGFAQRATPRLARRYAREQSVLGLAPGSDPSHQELRLRRYLTDLATAADRMADPPMFTVLLDVGPSDPDPAAALQSVGLQVYPHWRVLLSTSDPHTIHGLAAAHPERAHAIARAGTPAHRLRLAAAEPADYVIRLHAGDRLLPHALGEVARALDLHARAGRPAPIFGYGDERPIDETGMPAGEPVFKPGWSPLLLLSGGYTGGLPIVARDRVEELLALCSDDATDHELALAAAAVPAAAVLHVPHILHQASSARPLPARSSRQAAIQAGAAAARRPARITTWNGDRPHLLFALPDPAPRVSVIIPTRDRADLLRRCLNSIRDRTTYRDVEVIVVDNDSRRADTRLLLAELSDSGRATVMSHPGPFSFAAMNNLAAAAATGSVLVLLNNDTEVVTPDWLEQLVGIAVLPGVGAVGPQLRYPDGTIQHAGLIGLATAGTGHAFLARRPDEPVPLDLIRRVREVLAVTGACLAITRERYLAAGGLDETVAANDSGDVDLCLRLRSQGLVSVYTPQAVLIHHESLSRGRSFTSFERQYLLSRWPAELLSDPYLNPNLARSTRLEPDPLHAAADVPGAIFAQWLARGAI